MLGGPSTGDQRIARAECGGQRLPDVGGLATSTLRRTQRVLRMARGRPAANPAQEGDSAAHLRNTAEAAGGLAPPTKAMAQAAGAWRDD